ncbi:MAG: hypothetical protein ABI598_05500, partial [Chloroflexota bacterium]
MGIRLVGMAFQRFVSDLGIGDMTLTRAFVAASAPPRLSGLTVSRGVWLARKDSNLQSPDPESGA